MIAALREHAALPLLIPPHRARQFGRGLLAASCAAMGMVELATLRLLPELHPYGDIPTWVIALGGIAQLLGALLLIFPNLMRFAAAVLALLWFMALVGTATKAAGGANALPAWVPVFESAALCAAFLGLARNHPTAAGLSSIALRLAFGTMLVLFGLIHIVYRPAIAGMIPAWIPLETWWPLMTGGLMLLAGLALLVDRLTNAASVLVAALFASWLVIVHPGRIWSDPGSIAEWEFALTALALTGAAMMVARNAVPVSRSQPARATTDPQPASGKSNRRSGT
jgi:uncharacterized membrane protein